jgi:hypothetical protein
VAADLAFDALAKAYKPAELVLLQYHLHIPVPDPLTNPASEARQAYYDADIEGTPTIFFNGKPGASGGGPVGDSEDKHRQYRSIIDTLLEKPAAAKLHVTAARKGANIEITAEVTDVDKPAEQLRLRLALVEEQVRYLGGNGMRFHHHVVRAVPGGPDGLAVKGKLAKQVVSVDLGDLRKELDKYLTDAAKQTPFPNTQRPLDLNKLLVVAFLQDDRTKEVLQAVQVEPQPE